MELPNNAPNEELMDFKKFAQSVKKLIYSDERIMIYGVFKDKITGKIQSGDNFMANIVNESGKKEKAELIYKTYIEWFNRTLRPYENEREFVSAKFGSELK
jgi:hypothetical protein